MKLISILSFVVFFAPFFNIQTHIPIIYVERTVNPSSLDTIPEKNFNIDDSDTIQIVQIPTKEQLKHLTQISFLPIPASEASKFGLYVVKSKENTIASWSDDPQGKKYGNVKCDDCASVKAYYFIQSDIKGKRLAIRCSDSANTIIRSGAIRDMPVEK